MISFSPSRQLGELHLAVSRAPLRSGVTTRCTSIELSGWDSSIQEELSPTYGALRNGGQVIVDWTTGEPSKSRTDVVLSGRSVVRAHLV